MTDELDDSVATGRLHHIQVKLAFMADPDQRARPGRLLGTKGATMTVTCIDDGTLNRPRRQMWSETKPPPKAIASVRDASTLGGFTG